MIRLIVSIFAASLLTSVCMAGTRNDSQGAASRIKAPVASEFTQTPQLHAEECTVWQREQSFARSVATHDVIAFAEHVAEQATFDVGRTDPARGRDAIVKRFRGVIEGKQVRARWYPTVVTLGLAGDLAWSKGPLLIEDLDPKARHHFLLDSFHSVWRKDADGAWRVLLDDGGVPRPASAQEVHAFERNRADCSRA
ncbi:YybH family protein [Pseudomonas izuensis]|uniref:YybH family protein n=1 Tax=Pseudomonas izuensis TaxID=2684212 RepID=UPI00135AFFAE|nr:DUF4440 domain-containing protein [Pseudomonas izuensis]